MPFLGKGADGLAEEFVLSNHDGQLAPARPARMADNSDPVSAVNPLLEEVIFFFADVVELEIELHP